HRRLTFDMRGGRQQAKLDVGRPLDGRVRRLGARREGHCRFGTHRPSPFFTSSVKVSKRRRIGRCSGAPASMVFCFGSYTTLPCGPRCLPSYASNSMVFVFGSNVARILKPMGGGPPTKAPTPSAPRYIACPSNRKGHF